MARALASTLGVALLACGNHAPPPSPGAGALPVRVVALEPRPVSDLDEYLASLTSRRSLDLLPQVAAYVKAVHVRPGAAVRAGQVLIDLDPGQQLGAFESVRAAAATRRANLDFAIRNDESSRGLVRAGVLSELDYQQRHAQRVAAEADLRAAQAQVAAQGRLLAFYRITAPSTGVVGDVPVKVGDYVTPQTTLTSIAQNALVDVYVYVPISKAARLDGETRIRLLNQMGCEVCDRRPTFVSQQVDPNTQSVLIKTRCANTGQLREAEVLRARLVWSERPGLTVPTSAVTRLAGQFFVFVATPGAKGLIAQQRPIRVGTVQGNDYVVEGGLSAGDRVIVSNIQKLRPNMPISELPPHAAGSGGSAGAPATQTAEAGGRGPCPDISEAGEGGVNGISVSNERPLAGR